MLKINDGFITLSKGDTGELITGHILRLSSTEWFVGRVYSDGRFMDNNYVLRAYGFSNYQKQKQLFLRKLGYWKMIYPIHGAFPFCHTKEDVVKILRELDKNDEKDNDFINISFFL